ncbi:type II toxin-antitoxin system RelE/ParE family toxin [Achromobacter aegrifaciens]|uniref:type II toxin-antitoxin system RelE/ParE family toxin n=1 Tax=Achromobacter aegrifaciens TaxID=1287736 RepID=UPI000F740AAB|nr:type II toxin-antitoxin system RelE/ParE family toxin [Achromobacter aegrifaciens]RSF02739.1 hypothetical protein EGU54_12640 [Achromobacter aegrifaciens]
MYTVIESKAYGVWAVHQIVDGYKGHCPALEFLYMHAQQKQYAASANGFRLLFQRYATGGRRGLTTDLFHEVDNKESIWEFVKGDLRMFCFMIGNNVILTHGAIKKGQRVNQQEVAAAVRARDLLLPKLS